jgi:penicillin-binding protein 1A
VQEYGSETVRSGGLRVYTTIDRRLQQAGRDAIQRTLYLRDDPASALVAIDPRSGAIRAMTAVTPGRHGNQFNLASQSRRQAGSTFKTFVLTTAIDEGVNPNTTYYTSAPFHYQPDPYTEAWDVQTYDHTYVGSVSIASATLRSDNTVYAQLTLDLGPERVAAVAHKMGIQTSLTTKEGAYVPSMGLGAIAVSPLEMASAYATLAAQGVYSKPWVIRKVVLASGKEDEDAGWGVPERKRVLPDWVASEVTKILEQNMLSGTGTAAYFGRTAAGKTGTTDKHSDAWFCGYTPNLTTTVWVGYPRAQIPMENVHGIAVAGGTFPAQIWHLFMVRALGDTPPLEWPEPKSSPVWRPFTQGQYARYYTYDSNSYNPNPGYYSPPAATTSAATSRARPAPKPTTAPPPPPPPATTQPPPATTAAPPVTTGPEP